MREIGRPRPWRRLIIRTVRRTALVTEFHELMVLRDLHQVERHLPRSGFEQGDTSPDNGRCDMNDQLVDQVVA